MRNRTNRSLGMAWLGVPAISAAITVVLLGGIAYEVSGRDPAADPVEHHKFVKELARTTIPYAVDDWFGRLVESAPAAVELLHPNAMEGRAFVNSRTGESASLLFVQCSDARDILGHYPPVCYPAHGATLESAVTREWEFGDVRIESVRYRFAGKGIGSAAAFVVDNFMILPTGKCGRDMESVQRVAKDRRLRQFGAAQVQVLTDGSMSDSRRDEVFRLMVERILPLIKGVGVDREHHRD